VRARALVMMGLVAVLATTLVALVRATAAGQAVSVGDVAQGLTCQCGCGLTVANCNMPSCSFAVPTRLEIEKMIGEGKSRAQIIATFRAKYGEKVLSAPTTEGFNVLAWIMPFAAVVLGGAVMAITFARWRRISGDIPPAVSTSQPSAAAVDSDMRERLAREVKDQL